MCRRKPMTIRKAFSPNACGCRAACGPTRTSLRAPSNALRQAKKPVIIAGGGVLYSEASGDACRASPQATGIPVAETQAGKSSLPFDASAQHGRRRRHRHIGREPAGRGSRRHPRRRHAASGFHHRLLGAVQESGKTIIGLNMQVFDAAKHRALPLVADARVGLEELSANLGSYKAPARGPPMRRTASRRG